jgi:small ligand-binding sensory domain FIST
MQWASTAVTGTDLGEILADAVGRISSALPDARADLAFLFLSSEHASGAERAVAEVRRALGDAHVLGCCASGVIGAGREYEQVPALSLLAGSLPGAVAQGFSLTAAALPDPDAPPHAWHEGIGLSPADRPSFVVVADPLTVDAERLVQGLDFAYPGSVTVGGLASGARRAGRQVLLHGDGVLREGAVGIALMGDVEVATAIAHGCRPVGPPLKITHCTGHLLERLDDRPVLEAMQTVLAGVADDEEASARATVLLGFEVDPFQPRDEGPWLVRNLLGADPATGGVWVGEVLRPGRRVRFHLRDRETAHRSLEHVLDEARDAAPGDPEAALLFACTGRGRGLYGEPDHDARVFGARYAGAPLAGFFCDGEIGPAGGSTCVHGYAAAFGLLRPRGGATSPGSG